MYCEKCNLVVNGDICPNCGSVKLRKENNNDICYLIQEKTPWAEMLADILKSNKIPFSCTPLVGAGLSLRTGQIGDYKFFVPYEFLSQAEDVLKGIGPLTDKE
ncbi:MAG: hypothetical protein VB078_09545 [Clostridiaceae bacterium]|nr:hypothetical protein [Clostridiaceae bacterium]